jgi:hypothetical protein
MPGQVALRGRARNRVHARIMLLVGPATCVASAAAAGGTAKRPCLSSSTPLAHLRRYRPRAGPMMFPPS